MQSVKQMSKEFVKNEIVDKIYLLRNFHRIRFFPLLNKGYNLNIIHVLLKLRIEFSTNL